ncbi:hypothetical protein Tco_1540655 [Tanacetum coccineum]
MEMEHCFWGWGICSELQWWCFVAGNRKRGGGSGVLIVVDIQEVIGNTLAIKIWSNGVVPIQAGVLITALDCNVGSSQLSE